MRKRGLSQAASASLIGIATLFLPSVCRAQGYTITTVAGIGNLPYSNAGCARESDVEGDGCPATSALLTPYGAAIDSAGNLYVADSANGLVRKVSMNGVISVFAGGGTAASEYSGDGGPATSATLSFPSGLAVDSAGDIYIADTGNNRIRKVSTSGIITTVAGGGSGCAQQTDIEGDGYAATNARLSLGVSVGVAVDASGNLYIPDTLNQRIRKVAPSGTITTVAGSGNPVGALGDGGQATGASLQYPSYVAADAAGNLYIADWGHNLIRKVTVNGIINTVAGNGSGTYSGDGGPATTAGLYQPNGIAVDVAGNLYIADTGDQRVREVIANGTITTIAGNGGIGSSGDGGPATSATLNAPYALALGNGGTLYVADTGSAETAEYPTGSVRLLTPPASAASSPAVTGVANDASFAAGAAIWPGAWVAIFGANLAPAGDSRTWNTATEIVDGKLPLSLDGTSVTVNGKPAAVEFIQPSQVNIQTPEDTAVGPVQVVVTKPAGASNAFTVSYTQIAPGLFAAASPYIVAQHANNSYVSTAAPASPGEVIILWGTGFGPANPAVPAGQVFSGANPLANTVVATIGGQTAKVDFAGVVGAGLVQINVHVPSSIGNGDAAVVATVGGESTQTTANMIPIQN